MEWIVIPSQLLHQLSLKYALMTVALHLCFAARSSTPSLKDLRNWDFQVLKDLHLWACLNRTRSFWRASSSNLWWGGAFPLFGAFLGLLFPQRMRAWIMWNWQSLILMSIQTKKNGVSVKENWVLQYIYHFWGHCTQLGTCLSLHDWDSNFLCLLWLVPFQEADPFALQTWTVLDGAKKDWLQIWGHGGYM